MGEALQKQREMIDGLLQRVSRDEAAAARRPGPRRGEDDAR